MSEALDLSVNAAPTVSANVPTGPSAQIPQTSRVDSLDSSPPVSTLIPIPCGSDFLQKCASAFSNLPHSQLSLQSPQPNHPSVNILAQSQLSQTPNLPLGNDPMPNFVPLMLPIQTNGATSKEAPSNAIDLSLPTIFQTPQLPASEGLLNFGNNAPPIAMSFNPHLIPRSTANAFPPMEYLPLIEVYPRIPAPQDSKELLKKFSSFHECGHAQCRAAGLKEHFHCTDCYKVINRREETIRHVKWHRKRAESLQYGFMRYSSCDNCGYPHCSHNMKQTHYHCIRANCSKTYISTSDVQMHANFHRKDAVIMQEGFRRFRAAEDCGGTDCPFAKERTTHFHCQRPGCSFTFKNKADMEKHKNHHLKNDAIAKDGFRKFTKSENCNFMGCRYSGQVNHIHCIRPGCDYIVHSTSQISSHRRKHERRESINFPCTMAPQNHLILPPLNCENSNGEAVVAPNITASTTTATTSATTTPKPSPPQSVSPILDPQDLSSSVKLLKRASKLAEVCWQRLQCSSSPLNDCEDSALVDQILEAVNPSLKLFKDESSCDNEQCSLHSTGIDHFHCFRTGCMDTFEMDPEDKFSPPVEAKTISSGDVDSWREHWFLHAWQSILSIIGFVRCSGGGVCNPNGVGRAKSHLHCFLWPTCDFLIDTDKADAPRLLRHLTRHNQHFGTMMYQMKESSTSFASEVGGFGNHRKRGRPPKHSRDIHIPRLDIPSERCLDENPSALLSMEDFLSKPDMIAGGLKFFPTEDGSFCVDRCCPYYISKQNHFHCIRPRCYLATSNVAVANSHRREFHPYVSIEPGYEYFDRSIDCRRPACYAKRDSVHFHCLRPRCAYSFVRVSKMRQHTEFHEGGGTGGNGGGTNMLEKNEEIFSDSMTCFPQTTAQILPPLGLDKSTDIGEIMPFLMQFLTGQTIAPIGNVMRLLNPEGIESIEDKMDWTEVTEKDESTTMAQASGAPIAMDEAIQDCRLPSSTVMWQQE